MKPLPLWITLGCSLVMGCTSAPKNTGRKALIVGSFLSEIEISRVGDLMARDMLRETAIYEAEFPPRIAFVKIENDTNQYLFERGRSAYFERMQTTLQRALGRRVRFVDASVEEGLRGELAKWHLDEGDQQSLVRGAGARHPVDYLLGATFSSLDKVVQVPDKKGRVNNQTVIELQMTFFLVDAETAALVWQNNVTSAASYSTRDFHN